jgi:hypothetical protein
MVLPACACPLPLTPSPLRGRGGTRGGAALWWCCSRSDHHYSQTWRLAVKTAPERPSLRSATKPACAGSRETRARRNRDAGAIAAWVRINASQNRHAPVALLGVGQLRGLKLRWRLKPRLSACGGKARLRGLARRGHTVPHRLPEQRVKQHKAAANNGVLRGTLRVLRGAIVGRWRGG